MVPNVSQQKKTHKLNKQAQAWLLENASSKGVREMARELGIDPSSVSTFLKSRGAMVREEREERERTAVRHSLDNEDAQVSFLLDLAQGLVNGIGIGEGNVTANGVPTSIAGKYSGVVNTAAETVMKAAKMRGRLVDKREDVTNRTDQELLALLRGESGRPN